MSELWIDINSDLGESEESLANGTDFELMRYITSANVACGGHAGDERTMRETVRYAKQLEVAVGAHPGYPDRANFGRIESPMAAAEIEASVRDQIAALAEIAATAGREPGALQAARRAVSRRQQERGDCRGYRSRRAGERRATDHGRTSRIVNSDIVGVDGAVLRRRGLCRPRLRAGRHPAQTHPAGRAARRSREGRPTGPATSPPGTLP